MENPLPSPFLFTHVYDVDTVITALCSGQPCWLNTADGTLHPTAQGLPQGHTFPLEPLPPSTCTQLALHEDRCMLADADREILATWLQTVPMESWPSLFTQGRAGGWLYNRLKEYALEWLDTHNLIPPSLRHINRRTAPVGKPAPLRIVMED